MPIYEYRCESCGQQEEKLEPMQAPAEHECHACGSQTGMKRQLSVAAIGFVGGQAPPEPAGGGCCSGGGCPFV